MPSIENHARLLVDVRSARRGPVGTFIGDTRRGQIERKIHAGRVRKNALTNFSPAGLICGRNMTISGRRRSSVGERGVFLANSGGASVLASRILEWTTKVFGV